MSRKVPHIFLVLLFFFFFQVERVFLVASKSEATSLWGVPFSSSLGGLNPIFKDLPECWCLAVEMAAMSDILCGFFPNENKQV